MATTYYVERARIPWQPASREHVYPCGRNVSHDSRNRAYPWRRTRRAQTLTSQLWPRHIGILDQGQVGSCTGEEETGACGTGSVWDALSAGQRATLGQPLAYKFYSEAETIDGDGPYPPNDYGSSGPSAAQAAKNDGYISGYLHCFSLADVLDALETHALGIGANWYDSMDRPDSTGLVMISSGAQIRGGHEFLCRGKDIDRQLLFFDNSWGTGFGVNGSFSMSYTTLERLLSEQGDATVSLPLTVAPPVPVPVPPTPVPPVPTPTPTPAHDPLDQRLVSELGNWPWETHTGGNHRAALSIQEWMTAKHLH